MDDRVWNADTTNVVESQTWKPGCQTLDPWTEQLLSGPLEVVDYKHEALILYDSGKHARTPLRVSGPGGTELQREVATTDLMGYTHRAQLERNRTIRESYSEAVAEFRAQGLPEGEAMLKANDEMERMGYYPRTRKLAAGRIESGKPGIEVFAITNNEFRFDLFPDIEKALASPGTEVRFSGKYITHRDFDTSQKLNEYLDAGNTTFIVKTDRAMFLLQIQ